MQRNPTPSYISLFSSGGIGDLGFKDAGFHCVASAELISRRLEVQRLNNIAASEDLICGDLRTETVFNRILNRASEWTKRSGEPITCLLATPPCQGMSVANHKKGDELDRNSLVVRSLEAILLINPLTFVIENVPAFMKTPCTGLDKVTRPIGEEIERTLSPNYEFYSAVLPLEEFGSPSRRKRSITIGVRNDVLWSSPLDLFPDRKNPSTLRELIGDLPPLENMGEADPDDPLHAFRPYKEHMRAWIRNLPEGASAFDNKEAHLRPHRVIDGKIVPNVMKNGDKYRRVPWDSVPPCVHTRNDILASQNTVHPVDDRVFSIRELMRMMGIPNSFKWFGESSDTSTADLVQKHSPNIRQCLGEAMPYPIAKKVALRIKHAVWDLTAFSARGVKLKAGSWATTSQRAAYRNLTKESKKLLAAYYSQPLVAFSVLNTTIQGIPRKKTLRVLEPSSGGGVFISQLLKWADLEGKTLIIDSIDIDADAIAFQEQLFENEIPGNVKLSYSSEDYLRREADGNYDIILGNPPFGRKALDKSSQWSVHQEMSIRFFNKALHEGTRIALVMPKALLHANSYRQMRDKILERHTICAVYDLGEICFPEIKVETVGLTVVHRKLRGTSELFKLKSWPIGISERKPVSYGMDPEFPTWVIYRDKAFDEVCKSVDFGRVSPWRDRTISRKLAVVDGVPVIRGRNLGHGFAISRDDDFSVPEEIAIPVENQLLKVLQGRSFFAPNLSYNPRLVPRSSFDGVPDGSAAVLYGDLSETEEQQILSFCNSLEFRNFFRVACNHATRSINLDECLTYWWGVPKALNT